MCDISCIHVRTPISNETDPSFNIINFHKTDFSIILANTFFIFFDSIKPLIKLIKHLISDFQILFHSIKRPLIKNPKDTKLQPPLSLKIRLQQIRTTLKCFQIQMKNQRLTIRRYRTFKFISLAKLFPFLIINLPNIEIHFI